MKRALWFVCVLVFSAMTAGALSAQSNPFLGTWKLNLSKSKFDGMPAPKSLTRTVAADGERPTHLRERMRTVKRSNTASLPISMAKTAR